MRPILCPVDFSTHSILAAEWAAMLSFKTGRPLILMHKFVISSKEKMAKLAQSEDPFQDAKNEAQDRLYKLKSELCQKYREESIECDIQTVYGVDIQDVILDTTKKLNAGMIVMGTMGAESFQDLFSGSISSNIIEDASVPVLVIPAAAKVKVPTSIVYATDLQAEEDTILSQIIAFTRDLNAKITFLHVNDKGDNKLAKMKNSISHITSQFQGKGNTVEINYEELNAKDIFGAIEGYADKEGADLIVLGNHQKNFFEKLTEGNFTRLMALYTHKPLLVFQKKD